MSRRVVYYGERDLEGLRWTARIIDFGIGLSVTAAFNEIRNSYACLIESPLFRQSVKRDTNNVMRMIKQRECEIRSIMKDKSFWDDYSDTVIDLANNDVTLFRVAIKSVLDKGGYRDSNLVSYMETARVLLEMSEQHYDGVMADARERYGRNYSAEFACYDMEPIRRAWEKVTDAIYVGSPIDLNTREVKAMFARMDKKFAEGEYIKECLKVAMDSHPDFMENKIEVKD
jgi:hypothetical protein